MSNKRIRIKKAKAKKKSLIMNQTIEIANLIIKINFSENLIEKIHIKSQLESIRFKHIEQIRTINEVIKYGKRQLKGSKIISIA